MLLVALLLLSGVGGHALAGPTTAELASALTDFTNTRVTVANVRGLSCKVFGTDEPTEAVCSWQQRIGGRWRRYSAYVVVQDRRWDLVDEPTPRRLAIHAPPRLCLEAERATQGAVFCTPNYVSFLFVGRTAGSKYSIYNYHYRFLTHRGGVFHGGQRLIVFRGNRYLGNYMLLPEVSVAVRGSKVVLTGDEIRQTVRLDFSKKPPSQIWANGEVDSFWSAS
jgi:hypothetical protein